MLAHGSAAHVAQTEEKRQAMYRKELAMECKDHDCSQGIERTTSGDAIEASCS